MGNYVGELRKVIGNRPLIVAAAGVIVRNAEGHVLLQRRTDDGRWGIPGGALELGESFEQAARRELTEETSLIAGDLELLDVYSGAEFFITYANGDQVYVVGATYLANSVSGELKPDEDETLELRYFPTDELPDKLNDFNRRLLGRCRAKWSHLAAG